MTGRVHKVARFIGLKKVKYLKKLMSIYPMLLLLNRKEIALHLVENWTRWKCHAKKAVFVEPVTHNELDQITLSDILRRIRQNDKGIEALCPSDKLWICSYILSNGGKSFVSHFSDHLQTEDMLTVQDREMEIKNVKLYAVYYGFCEYLMLCDQFPLSKEGMSALQKWWNEVQCRFGFGFQTLFRRRRGPNIKMPSNREGREGRRRNVNIGNVPRSQRNVNIKNKKKSKKKRKERQRKEKVSRKRQVKLVEKLMAIRDIIYGQKSIEDLCKVHNVKAQTILLWIKSAKRILVKCQQERRLEGDRIWGIFNDQIPENVIPENVIPQNVVNEVNTQNEAVPTNQNGADSTNQDGAVLTDQNDAIPINQHDEVSNATNQTEDVPMECPEPPSAVKSSNVLPVPDPRTVSVDELIASSTSNQITSKPPDPPQIADVPTMEIVDSNRSMEQKQDDPAPDGQPQEVLDPQNQHNQNQQIHPQSEQYEQQQNEVTNPEETFKMFLDKTSEYLKARRQRRRSRKNRGKEEMDESMDEGEISVHSDESEYDPMNESATNRRVASTQHGSGFEREYQTRNIETRGRIPSHELRYTKGYYRGSTFKKVAHEDVAKYKEEEDSESGCDDEWLLEWERKLLFDFEDISYGEKLMMHLWNVFIRERAQNRIWASFLVPVKLLEFAESRKKQIVENKLSLPFLFHCITLWEFGFIESKCIEECMQIVHQYGMQNSKEIPAEIAESSDIEMATRNEQ